MAQKWQRTEREKETLNIYTIEMEQDYNKYIVGVRFTE